MVEVVERPLGDHDVALRVDVGADVEHDLRVVVDVDVLVDDHDPLRQAQHPETPDRVHHLASMPRERLPDRDDREVVERARDRQVVVDDLGNGHLDRGQEDALGRLAEPGVLLRRLADDDRRVDRVASHRDRRHVEDREALGRRVEAGVVAERPFVRELALVDVSLEHDLRVGRHLEVDGHALDELDRLAAQEARDHQLVDVLRQRRARRVRGDRVETERDRDLHPPLGEQVVGAAVLVDLPVHRGRARAEHLHPVHADVPAAGARVAGDHGRQRDERPGVAGPAPTAPAGAPRSTSSPRSTISWRGAAPDDLRPRVGDRLQRLQPAHLRGEALGRLHLEHVGELRGDVVEPLDAEREAHPPLGAELVDQQRVLGALRMLEEQRRPAGLDGAVDDLRHLEVRIDLRRDANELALALEKRDPLAQVAGGHGGGR